MVLVLTSTSTGTVIDSQWTTDRKKKETGKMLLIYQKTELFWVALILADLVAQGCRTAESSDSTLELLSQIALADSCDRLTGQKTSN